MKILIASPDASTSRLLNLAVGELAPTARYLHADNAERMLELVGSHHLDLVLMDLQLVAKDVAASMLLRLLNVSSMAVSSPFPMVQSLGAGVRPGVLLTFDSKEQGAGGEVLARLRTLKTGCQPDVPPSSTLWAQDEEGEWSPIDIKGLKWAVAEEGRVRLYHASNRVYTVRDPLRELERQLGETQFVRIHKSYLVNSHYVSEVQRWSSGGLLLMLEGARLPVSRRFVAAFRERTGWGVGPVRPRLSAC